MSNRVARRAHQAEMRRAERRRLRAQRRERQAAPELVPEELVGPAPVLMLVAMAIAFMLFASAAWGSAMARATLPTLYGPCPYPLSAPLPPNHDVDYSRFDAFGPGRTFADL